MDDASDRERLREIWLAGGCFWGVQAYFAQIDGVVETSVGYANGQTENPSYEQIPFTGHVEAVQISYDPNVLSLESLLAYFFRVIDPTVRDKQGPDIGKQYRTGIYYKDELDLDVIQRVIGKEQSKYRKRIVTEVMLLQNYFLAEEYHQDYLKKNPGGYCHIDLSNLPEARLKVVPFLYSKPAREALEKRLSPMQFSVTQEDYTEPPFANEFWDNKQKGIYVDIVTGEPLFVSSDKFDSGCGWPSFTRPIDEDVIVEKIDRSRGRLRMEVRSRVGDSHLGHVFDDGPKEEGGLRYCINSASLEFIPLEKMEEKGYARFIPLVR